MRNWKDWLTPLKNKFKKIKDLPFSRIELDRFLEVELCLRLHEKLIPDHHVLDVYALLSGYQLPSVPSTIESRTMCSIARRRVRYLRTKSSWREWLERYCAYPKHFRMYDVNLKQGTSKRIYVAFVQDRVVHYDEALCCPARWRINTKHWAQGGEEYYFTVEGETERRYIRFPEALARKVKDHPKVPKEVTYRRKRSPIQIHMDELLSVAKELQKQDPKGNWIWRVQNLRFHLVKNGLLIKNSNHFTIDGLFHLVGMVGAGKSTLIHLLTYYLVKKKKLHITLMVGTVSEAIDMAAQFTKIGISAAPALGVKRNQHRAKYGQAHVKDLNPKQFLYQSLNKRDTAYIAARWLTASCALNGLVEKPIPVGQEPCNRLIRDGKTYDCPLRPICPVHQANHDLVNSRVWIVNPASFIYSQAPENLNQLDMRFLEAIYYYSDLVIIDEADRVQVLWDRMFAPINDLFGKPEALLDKLQIKWHTRLSQTSWKDLIEIGYRQVGGNLLEAAHHASHLMHMILNNPDLVKWISQRPLTNYIIIRDLAEQFAKDPYGNKNEEVEKLLFEAFSAYSRNATSLQRGGRLAELVNNPLYLKEGVIRNELSHWIQQFLPWSLKEIKNKDALLRKLEFGVFLIVMDEKWENVLRNWGWITKEVGDDGDIPQTIPTEYSDLVPDSPIGWLLGYQYTQNEKGGGLFRYIHCLGIGRWILYHFHEIFAFIDGTYGPHVFITSATSWAPGSPQFHLSKQPDALLIPTHKELEAPKIYFEYKPFFENDKPIRVSGFYGNLRTEQIKKLALRLSIKQGEKASFFQRELDYWVKQNPEQPRKILLVVGSYKEARIITHVLNGTTEWNQRVLCMLPDDDPDLSLDSISLSRGEIESFSSRDADILVAPLLAIQRGFNILDDHKGALLGSAFFLVRPFPVPDDISQHVIGINQKAMQLILENKDQIPSTYGKGAQALIKYRRDMYKHWSKRLSSFKSNDNEYIYEVAWDQFVIVWQTVGRLVRGNRSARVFFVDGAFHQSNSNSTLFQWYNILNQYLGDNTQASALDIQLAKTLYEPAYQGLKQILFQLGGVEDAESFSFKRTSTHSLGYQ
jgi:hypothetical protein